MATTRITVSTHGRFFTGHPQADLRREIDDLKEEVGRSGEQMVRQRLGARLKNPTGHYTGQIRAERSGRFNDWAIHDGGVIYGPWLESGKYSPPRRFKGYHIFRSTTPKLRRWYLDVAQRRIDKLVARWNS